MNIHISLKFHAICSASKVLLNYNDLGLKGILEYLTWNGYYITTNNKMERVCVAILVSLLKHDEMYDGIILSKNNSTYSL